jgi:hypothetical protein
MRTDLYHVISDASEDRFGEAESLEQAIRIAHSVVRKGHAGPVCIEHRGFVIRLVMLTRMGRWLKRCWRDGSP